jgi:acetyl/propionyl-CoA carboxylase alpha subunit/crotonobetainyl-CoA:carnitine CoA-transferase CaiB-like acyl-CoA transferase
MTRQQGYRPIKRLLVANRGVVARRIIRTARVMGMRGIAIFAESDADAAFVRDADLAVPLADVRPGVAEQAAYLDAAAIVEAAKRTDADAVHPGYGFLAENADFAEACSSAGLTLVGPQAAVIRAMAIKHTARELASAAGLPVLPALPADEAGCRDAASKLGFPLLVKASAGGGGVGIQRVDSAEELVVKVGSARATALRAFADDTVFLEKMLASPRHIEVQIVGDRYGTVVHLGERECSIQRRHQKIIEESPSVAVSAELREHMAACSVDLATSLGYVGVGTVEYLLDTASGEFYFLEMNTRLQVEHAVTEERYGVDLVRVQLEIAQGLPAASSLSGLTPRGHVIEARVYAEDPASDFRPAAGPVSVWHHEHHEGVRWESALDGPGEVNPFYDPLLAKVIARASTRTEACAKLTMALAGLRAHAPATNRDLLIAVLETADFEAGRTHTDFLALHPELLKTPNPDVSHLAAAIACTVSGRRGDDTIVPPGWRVLRDARTTESTWEGARATHHVRYRLGAASGDTTLTVALSDQCHEFVLRDLRPDGVRLRVDSVERAYQVVRSADGMVWVNDTSSQSWWREQPRLAGAGPGEQRVAVGVGGSSQPSVSMPGTVVEVHVKPGDRVHPGQLIAVLETMKTEQAVTAAMDGVVERVTVRVGDQVPAGTTVATITSVAPIQADTSPGAAEGSCSPHPPADTAAGQSPTPAHATGSWPLEGFTFDIVGGPNRIVRTAQSHLSLLGGSHDSGSSCGGSASGRPDSLAAVALHSPAGQTVTGEVCGWEDLGYGPFHELAAQAAFGTTSVHARARGEHRPLGVDYLSVNAATMLIQGVLALAVGNTRGMAADHVKLDVAGAALFPVTQYIAGATATEDAEKGIPEPAEGAAPPPFRSADDVWFELECLSAEPWREFWCALGAPSRDVARSWRSFLLRYPIGTAALAPSLHDAAATRTYAEIRALVEQAPGMNVTPVRRLCERRAELQDSGGLPLSPWRVVPAARTARAATPLRPDTVLPLDGMVVVESCRRVQGPLAGRLLHLLGATVVRVEMLGGDPLRGVPPMAGDCSARFVALNDGKHIVEVDLKSAAGHAEMLELVETADVFLHNWAPGKAAELGLSASDLHMVNPGLVYTRASGWGPVPSPGGVSGTDFMVQAHSGIGELVGSSESPRGSLMTLLDILGGQMCAQGTLAGLLARQRSGKGQCVNTSLLGAGDALIAEELMRPAEPATAQEPLSVVVPTADGAIAIATAAGAARCLSALGAEVPDGTTLSTQLRDILATCQARDMAVRLHESDVAAVPVRTDLAALARDPALSSRFIDRGCAILDTPWTFT